MPSTNGTSGTLGADWDRSHCRGRSPKAASPRPRPPRSLAKPPTSPRQAPSAMVADEAPNPWPAPSPGPSFVSTTPTPDLVVVTSPRSPPSSTSKRLRPRFTFPQFRSSLR